MNWYANIRNRVSVSEKRKEKREQREQEALNSVIFGSTQSAPQDRRERAAVGINEELLPHRLAGTISERQEDTGTTTSAAVALGKSSDLLMLSKINPTIRGSRNSTAAKRKLAADPNSSSSLLSGYNKAGAGGKLKKRKEKKKYESAFEPNTSTSAKKVEAAVASSGGMRWSETMQPDVIDHLDLSPPVSESTDESKKHESLAEEILFFNDGIRVSVGGIPILGANGDEAEEQWSFGMPSVTMEEHPQVQPHPVPAPPRAAGRKLNLADLFDGELSSFL